MFVIDHERYGCRTEFDSLEEAVTAIRDCGEDFEDVTLRVRGNEIVDDRGDIVGEVIEFD